MDQILQYLTQHTTAIEQLLSREQTQGEAAKIERERRWWASSMPTTYILG